MKAPGKTWFGRHRKLTLMLTVSLLLVLIDGSAGLLLIPEDFNTFRRPDYHHHHDLLPNRKVRAKWGDRIYSFCTNSLGFRDGKVRDVPLESSKRRILFLGDSFAEGVGVTYEESFTGVLDQALEDRGVEIMNASVISYSPKLYYLKTRYLIENLGLAFDELFVFMDISDIQNEISYEKYEPDRFKNLLHHLDRFLRERSYLYHSVKNLFAWSKERSFEYYIGLDREYDDFPFDPKFLTDGAWTIDESLYEKYGKKGLELCRRNMKLLAGFCRDRGIRLTLVVYPWPLQIYYSDLDSIQVKYWREFAAEEKLQFIDLFPLFIKEKGESMESIDLYFIPGDMHWNFLGHRLVAEKLLEYIDGSVSARSGVPDPPGAK